MTSCIDSGWLIVAMRVGAARDRECQLRGPHVFGAQRVRPARSRRRSPKRRPRRRTRDAPTASRDDRDEVVTRANERRSHRNRNQAGRRLRPGHESNRASARLTCATPRRSLPACIYASPSAGRRRRAARVRAATARPARSFRIARSEFAEVRRAAHRARGRPRYSPRTSSTSTLAAA